MSSKTFVVGRSFVRAFGCGVFMTLAALGQSSVTVAVTPAQSNIATSATLQFSAAVTGSANTAVTWSISPQVGTISATGLYTAPASIARTQTVTVKATSAASATAAASATITIQGTIAVTPGTVTANPGQQIQFAAAVTGLTNGAVTWSVCSGSGGMTSQGLYTPPSSSSPQTATIKAAAVADGTIFGTATVNILPIVTVTISPSSKMVGPGSMVKLSAAVTGVSSQTVNWSILSGPGTMTAAGVYVAPAKVTSLATVIIGATSTAPNSNTAKATVQVQAGTVQTLATFNLTELFGATWPDQPIEFRYDGGQPPANTIMVGPDGNEAAFQWVSSCSDATALKGCIAVRDSLPANANYTWTLESGPTPQAAPVNPVALNVVGNNYQITNGLTGVRIITAAANGAPYDIAPIQGLLLPNGTWVGAGSSPNLLYNEGTHNSGCIGCPLKFAAPNATGFTVTVVDAGPLKTVLKANYTFNRPKYTVGSTLVNTAGTGHYTLIVTMYANSKSVLVDEDSDMQFSYYLPLYNQLSQTQARYRGHDSISGAGAADPACGYETPMTVTAVSGGTPILITAGTGLSNGQRVGISGVLGDTAANGTFYAKTNGYPAGQFALYVDSGLTTPVAASGAYSGGGVVKPAYRGQSLSLVSDALLDLNYSVDDPAFYECYVGPTYYGNRKLLVDYPSANHAAGWYEEIYDAQTSNTTDPVLGIYIGRFSLQNMSATGPSTPGIYSSNDHWITSTTDGGIQVDNLLRGPSGITTPLVHRNWGIFVSTKADLAPLSSHQPISDEQNMLTGINLSRLYTYQLVYPDPPGGWTWMYMSPTGANQLIADVQNGTSVCGSVTCYYSELHNSEGSTWGTALLNMWQGNSSAAVQTALNSVTALAQELMQQLTTGDNRFGNLSYYNIGLQSSSSVALINAILMNPNTTAAQKTLAKAELALFGSIMWDDDWFPIDNTSGDSDGLANQIQQYLEYRTQYAVADAAQPFLATKLSQAVTASTLDLESYFSPTGAAAGSTHYQSAFFEPLIMNYVALENTGQLSMADPRWAAYANWELSIQTPSEPRFGNIRKGYSDGDGNTEADVRTGMLGTAMNSVNPTVAGNLMWAWRQSNSSSIVTEDAQFMTTIVAIDQSIPSIQPAMASTNIPGYHSVERFGFGTPDETAVWFINGGFYSPNGHRHADDGQVSIYADSAPLAIDWNANLYNPETPGRFMHDAIVYDSELSHLWSADTPSLSDASNWMTNPTNTEFESFANSTHAVGTFIAPDGTTWTRAVRTMAFDQQYPVIYVEDTFAGPSAQAGKTLTWNLMATGAVTTPAGSVTPTTRFSSGCQSPAGQLPSNGTVYSLGEGLQWFNFTGANWVKHASGGINWDLYLIPQDATGQFLIGNWGHGCHGSREMGEYQKANGTAFAEVQDILRVHDTGPFATVMLPYPKTAAPTRTVTQAACGTQITQGAEQTCFNNSVATYTNGNESVLTVYDGSTQTAFGVTASGGPQEVVIANGQVTWTISGVAPGVRSVTVPGGNAQAAVQSVTGLAQSGNTFTYAWPGGQQTQSITITLGN